jgi:hypothetical protein
MSPTKGGPSHFDMDDAFCIRMCDAIAAGLENAPIGVVTTPRAVTARNRVFHHAAHNHLRREGSRRSAAKLPELARKSGRARLAIAIKIARDVSRALDGWRA